MITSNYFFDNMTHISEDHSAKSQINIENSKANNYMLKNFYPECPMSSAIDLALKQPNVFYNGSHQVGIDGCNIDINSELKNTEITKPPCRINLLERPFKTVPYLGKGPYECQVESDLIQGILNNDKKKSINPISEYSYSNYKNYPLIPQIEKTIANPKNCVESVASEDWIRGGLPSRDYMRNSDNN